MATSLDPASPIPAPAPAPARRPGRPARAAASALEDRILDAAWQVVEGGSADLFSVDQVAQQARVSKRTIYSRFGSKERLIHRMVDRGVADYLSALRQRFEEQGLRDMLEAHASIAVRYMSSPAGKALTRLIDKQAETPGSGDETVAHSSQRAACAGVEAMLRDAAARGEIEVADPGFAAAFWVEALVGHVRVGGVPPDDIAGWARTQTDLFMRALRR